MCITLLSLSQKIFYGNNNSSGHIIIVKIYPISYLLKTFNNGIIPKAILLRF